MDINWMAESIGITSSLLIALSMTLKNIKSLRLINLMGCITFVIYGVIIHSLSVTMLNCFTGGVNIFYLARMRIDRYRPETFEILNKNPENDDYIQRFFNFYLDDIKRFFPSFNLDPGMENLKGAECFMILRGLQPVSVVIFRRTSQEEISVILDYAIPAYRDCKNGHFFFDTAVSQLASKGTVFNAVGEVPAHSSYLRKIGFKPIFINELGEHFRKEFKG